MARLGRGEKSFLRVSETLRAPVITSARLYKLTDTSIGAVDVAAYVEILRIVPRAFCVLCCGNQ